MIITKILGGGLDWYYLITEKPFKVIASSHQDNKEGMSKLYKLLKQKNGEQS